MSELLNFNHGYFGGKLSQLIFSIGSDGKNYSMLLPDWKTDYIQGMLAEKAVPYELEMLNAMSEMLYEGDLVLDIGANIGNHTLFLAAVVGCDVVAFEPNPVLALPLQESILINKLEDHVSLIQKGVGSAEDKAFFTESKPDNLGAQSLTLLSEHSQAFDSRNVMDVVSLDSIAFDRTVKAIKIDVEGMELDVLKGAEQLIENDKPSLFIESHDEKQFMLIYSFLEKWGYVYWKTFNATPTNWFVPLSFAVKADLQQHSLEQGKTFYKLWDDRQRVRKSLLDLRIKYRSINKKLVNLQTEVEEREKIVNKENQGVKLMFDTSSFNSPKKNNSDDFLFNDFSSQLEPNLGLDFSLPEDKS